MKLPDKSEAGVHTVSPDVTLEWRHGGAIFFLTLKATTREALDIWYDVIQTAAGEWDPDQPFLAIYDLSGLAVTPYFRKRGNDVADAVRHLTGRYAILVSNDLESQLMTRFFNLDVRRVSAREGQVFKRVDNALPWLEELL